MGLAPKGTALRQAARRAFTIYTLGINWNRGKGWAMTKKRVLSRTISRIVRRRRATLSLSLSLTLSLCLLHYATAIKTWTFSWQNIHEERENVPGFPSSISLYGGDAVKPVVQHRVWRSAKQRALDFRDQFEEMGSMTWRTLETTTATQWRLFVTVPLISWNIFMSFFISF